MIKKAHLLKLTTPRELSQILESCSVQAINQWGEFIPNARVYELMIKRPQWFAINGELRNSWGKK